MTCRELIEFIMDYLEGELPPEVRAHIEEHLHLCPPCVHFYQSYQITIRITRQLAPTPMPKSLDAKLQAMLHQIKEAGDANAAG